MTDPERFYFVTKWNQDASLTADIDYIGKACCSQRNRLWKSHEYFWLPELYLHSRIWHNLSLKFHVSRTSFGVQSDV